MMKRRRFKPFRQGQLDGLCGPYSLINAVHYLVGPINNDQATDLLRAILQYVEERRGSPWQPNEGMLTDQLERILRDVVLPRYPIRRRRVARRRREMNARGFFTRIARFFDQTGGVVLSGYEGVDSHWTVFVSVTRRTIVVFDSGSRRFIRRSSCTTNRSSTRHRVILYPTCSYYLWRVEEVDS